MANAELQAFLLELGATPEQLAHPNELDKVAFAGDLALGKGLDRTAQELADEVGIALSAVEFVYTALGLDIGGLAGFGDRDVALMRLIADDTTGLLDQLATELLRVTGSSMRRIAESAVAAYVQDIEPTPRQQEVALVELAQLNNFASNLVVTFSDTIGAAFPPPYVDRGAPTAQRTERDCCARADPHGYRLRRLGGVYAYLNRAGAPRPDRSHRRVRTDRL